MGSAPIANALSATGMTRVAPSAPPHRRTAGRTTAGTRRDAHHPRAAGRGKRRGPVEQRGAGPRSEGGGRLARSPARQGAGPRTLPHAELLAQRGVQLLPRAVVAPGAERVVDRPPGRQIARQQPPGAAAPDQVEDGIEDYAVAVDPRPTARRRRLQIRFEQRPFRIGQIGRVAVPFHAKSIATAPLFRRFLSVFIESCDIYT